ncbi:MAG: NUDIX hydrolase [Sphingobium sp.]
MTLPPVRDAGTLVVMRPRRGDGVPELLMTQRAVTLRFAGGAMVFPGGAVDDADRLWADDLTHGSGPGVEPSDMAARIAAVRETIEECGLLLTGANAPLPRDRVAMLREALHRGEELRSLIRQGGPHLDFEALVPFARWCPRAFETRIRYDTRFYVAVTDGVHDDLIPDGSETASLVWASAQDMLARADEGRARIIFPTRCNLERLAQFSTVDAVVEHARLSPPTLISPWIETRAGQEYLCIPEGLGYPVTARSTKTALRG